MDFILVVNVISETFLAQIGLYLGCKRHFGGAFLGQFGLYLGCKRHFRGGFHRAN
ncbi:hypothetical protein [Gracilibacillus sp. JCM 18860]|uniref:hypothetical protein n=1 Tax=Gracilibacillus sp. JCM 18860 TaxID=1306159 RepID=UPI000A67993B